MLKLKNNFFLAFFAVILLSAYLRFFNLFQRFVVEGDLEHHVYLAGTLVRNFHPIWIGVNIGETGAYHGPWFSYFTALWMYLSGSNPEVFPLVSASIGVLTTALVLFTGYKLFGAKTSLLSGLLYATLPLIVFHDQRYWNPTPTMFLSVIMLLSLAKVIKNSWWWIPFFISYGLVFSTHLSLFPYIFIAFYVWRGLKRKFSKQFILGIAGFCLVISPLIVFDYYQRGANITAPIRLLQGNNHKTATSSPQLHLESAFQTLGRFWYLSPNHESSDESLVSCTSISDYGTDPIVDSQATRTYIPAISLLSALLLFAFFVRKKTWKIFESRLVALAIILISGSFLIFPGGAYEYYLLGIFPLLTFIPGLLIGDLPKKWQKAGICLVLIICGLGTYSVLTAKADYGLEAKRGLIAKVMPIIADNAFEIEQDTSVCHQYEGWRYLFKTYGKTPARAFSDRNLGWYYSDEIQKGPVPYRIIIGDSRVMPYFDPSGTQIVTSGNFKAYIIKN